MFALNTAFFSLQCAKILHVSRIIKSSTGVLKYDEILVFRMKNKTQPHKTNKNKNTKMKTSGQDLFLVVPDSTLPRFIKSQLVASCQLEFFIMFLLSLNCLFQIIKKWSAYELS